MFQVFLFGDHQIKEEAFLEDVNMILNTADIPNLYENEERLEIIEKVSPLFPSVDFFLSRYRCGFVGFSFISLTQGFLFG